MTQYVRKRDAWWAWHQSNPHVWGHFERFALEAVGSGRKRISHWLIVNRIRWEVSIATSGSDFKIANDFIAFYARLWRLRYPRHAGLFCIKRMDGEPEDLTRAVFPDDVMEMLK